MVLERSILAPSILAITLLAAFALMLSPSPALAANHYIRAGASGSAPCSDWSSTNACNDLPASLVRGDTYYIASGTYARHVFNDPESSTAVIVIKRATVAGHGTDTGWSAGYDGTVQWSTTSTVDVWEIINSYYTFEGVTGSGVNPGAYGFLMHSDTNFVFAFVRTLGAVGNITINHVEVNGVNCCDVGNSTGGSSAIYSVSTQGSPSASINLSYDYFHDMKADPVFLIWNSSSTLDHLVLAVNRSTAAEHGQGMDTYGLTNVTLKNSTFIDITGTAEVTNIGSGNSSNVAIYGNVFYFTGSDPQWSSCTGPCVQDGGLSGPVRSISKVYASIPGAAVTGLKFYNNTMFGFDTNHAVNAGFYPNASDTGYDVQDNLWLNAQAGVSFDEGSMGTHDYNTILNGSIITGSAQGHETVVSSGASNPFVSSGLGDFHLVTESSTGISSGVSFSSPYNIDPDNNIRGADGTWERGAYEFNSLATKYALMITGGVTTLGSVLFL